MRFRKNILYVLSFSLLSPASFLAQTQSTQVPGSRKDPGLFSDRNKGKKDKDDDTTRAVTGVVSDPAGNPVSGAVVKMKDLKTGWLRSFITKEDGAYRFTGLSTNIDYQLHADYKELASDTRTLTVFDSRKQPVMNLKLSADKEKDKDRDKEDK